MSEELAAEDGEECVVIMTHAELRLVRSALLDMATLVQKGIAHMGVGVDPDTRDLQVERMRKLEEKLEREEKL